jgi:hypothetical protein
MTTETDNYVCSLTNEGWQMYTYEWEDGVSKERARSKRRGLSLSKRLTKLVEAAKAKLAANPLLSEHKLAESVRDEMHKLMNKYADDGAMDTEPQCVLVAELERAFGLDRYSLERW